MLLASACGLADKVVEIEEEELEEAVPIPSAQIPSPVPQPPTSVPGAELRDKWDLWSTGTQLRGANIWQAVVIPELDGLEFKGPGPVGPPFSQEDFDRLAELGANYVSISGPGLFTETPPYEVDAGVQANLDNLLAMIGSADMFATIGFRTGPGRSEFTLCCGGDPYFDGYFNDSVWEDQVAQDAWVEMWAYTAERYGLNPIVAGFKLMVEPNAPGVFFEVYEPEEFYPEFADTLFDWNQLYPRIVSGIRDVDTNTPILIGGTGWSGVVWLPSVIPVDDQRTVYVVHQYEPQEDYSHQEPNGSISYPGSLDLDYDGEEDSFDKAWLEDLLSPVAAFATRHDVPIVVDEFGANRWVPGAAEYLDDEMALFEQYGFNYTIWEWQTSWEPFAEDVHDMNYLLGPDPENISEFTTNDILNVLIKYWDRNTIRPSTFTMLP
jgi:hypothetical protein